MSYCMNNKDELRLSRGRYVKVVTRWFDTHICCEGVVVYVFRKNKPRRKSVLLKYAGELPLKSSLRKVQPLDSVVLKKTNGHYAIIPVHPRSTFCSKSGKVLQLYPIYF